MRLIFCSVEQNKILFSCYLQFGSKNKERGLFSKAYRLCSHLRFAHLFSLSSKWRWVQKLSHKDTQSDFGSSSECVCRCHHSHTCMYTLVAKQTQVFGVFMEITGPLQPPLLLWLYRCDWSFHAWKETAVKQERLCVGKHPQHQLSIELLCLHVVNAFMYSESCWHQGVIDCLGLNNGHETDI